MLLTTNKSWWSLLWAAALIAISSSPAAATNIAACGTFGAGSYTVINNISSAGINCLIFNAGPVTLDLNGFTVSGSGNGNGVLATGIANVSVRNGTIKGFARGVFANGAGAIIDGVRAITGAVNGFTVGDNGTVENSLITGHSVGGIVAGKIAAIVGNTISGTAGNLIVVSDGSLVKGNRVTQNSTSASSAAILVSQTCKVLDNVISAGPGHPGFGVAAGTQNLISGNTVSGFQTGIIAEMDNVISGNNASGNASGITCNGNCLVSGNTSSEPFTSSCPGPVAIHAGGGSQVQNNVTNFGCTGLEIGCPSKVADNTAVGNNLNLFEITPGGATPCLTTGNLAP